MGLGVAAQPSRAVQPCFGDINGKPWDPKRMLIQWNGSSGRVTIFLTSAMPHRVRQPGVYHAAGRDGTPVCHQQNGGSPFPEHYEPIETPLGTNPLHRTWCLTRLFVCMNKTRCGWVKRAVPVCGYDLSSDRALPHLTKHALLNAIAQPEQFVEISERWRRRKALIMAIVSLSQASWLYPRGGCGNASSETAECKCQQVETVGIPIHWGFEGVARKVISLTL